MHNRPLGKTGLSVSEIGYGAWGIGGSGWIGAQEDESVRALHRAIELGDDYQPDNALDLVRSGHVDAVQVIYNAFHQAPEEHLLPACAEHGVGVIVRVALDEGGLTGRVTPDTTFPDGDFRNSFFGGDRKAQVKQHVDALVADLGIEQDQIAEVALRYVLSRDVVSTVIAGMRTVRNVERNAAVGDGRGLSAAQQAIVARHLATGAGAGSPVRSG